MSAIEEAQETVRGIEGTEGWIEVAHDSDGGYDWSAITIFYSPSARRYFWFRDSGCSCTGHMDDAWSIGEFEDGDRQAAIKEANDWSNELAAEVRAFNPGKVEQ